MSDIYVGYHFWRVRTVIVCGFREKCHVFSRLSPSVTLNIRIAASRDGHSIHHGFSEELTKNFFFRYFSYDKHILANKFIFKKCTCLWSENHSCGNYWV